MDRLDPIEDGNDIETKKILFRFYHNFIRMGGGTKLPLGKGDGFYKNQKQGIAMGPNGVTTFSTANDSGNNASLIFDIAGDINFAAKGGMASFSTGAGNVLDLNLSEKQVETYNKTLESRIL